MDFLLDALTEWLKEMLVGGIMGNLSGMFDSVNQQVGDISVQVGQTPQGWNGGIFSMIQSLSNSIMVPIAGVILAIVMTLELIQMITDKNNLHDVDTWMISNGCSSQPQPYSLSRIHGISSWACSIWRRVWWHRHPGLFLRMQPLIFPLSLRTWNLG